MKQLICKHNALYPWPPPAPLLVVDPPIVPGPIQPEDDLHAHAAAEGLGAFQVDNDQPPAYDQYQLEDVGDEWLR